MHLTYVQVRKREYGFVSLPPELKGGLCARCDECEAYESKFVLVLEGVLLKVGSYDTYLQYWRSLTPQVITFDPEGVRA
jgi:hypothetical protein